MYKNVSKCLGRLDSTRISLVFANVTENDILLREELDLMARLTARFSVYYVLNDPPPGGSMRL
jgi:cytochrome-b5 reductase